MLKHQEHWSILIFIILRQILQGYIIHITPQKNEDIILRILTPQNIKTLYRFYGARHSIIELGKKIDFEIQNDGLFMPKLRNITALNFIWERDLMRVQIWQRYLQLLHKHFDEIHHLDSFYFNMLEEGAYKMLRQNPMRVILELYATLLVFEGRIPQLEHCFLCHQPLEQNIGIIRSFLPIHPTCLHQSKVFPLISLKQYLQSQSTKYLDDDLLQDFWHILIQGI